MTRQALSTAAENKQLLAALSSLSQGMQQVTDSIKLLQGLFVAEDGSVKPSVTVVETAKQRKKRTKKVRDPNAPKMPLSSYMLFARDNRMEIKESAESTLNPQDTVKEIARRWRELPEESKKEYQEEAESLRENYSAQLSAYRNEKKEETPDTHQTVSSLSGDESGSSSDDDSSSAESDEIVAAPVAPAAVKATPAPTAKHAAAKPKPAEGEKKKRKLAAAPPPTPAKTSPIAPAHVSPARASQTKTAKAVHSESDAHKKKKSKKQKGADPINA